MNDFLKETFRPYTPEEQAAIHRYRRQRSLAGLCMMAVIAVVFGLVFLSKSIICAPYQGTWIAAEDYADGFDKDDAYLECTYGTFTRSGDRYGDLEVTGDRHTITVNAPVGSYDCCLTADGDTLTIEYTLPNTAVIYHSGFTPETAGAWNAYGVNTPMISQMVEENEKARHRVDTYIRISTETSLTPDERDALY